MTEYTSEWTIRELVARRNAEKALFTAGPASLLNENLTGLVPCFGRGDHQYETLEQRVLDRLKAMTGHPSIARLQGSATLALEIAALNFLQGHVLVLASGYYSERLHALCRMAQKSLGAIQRVSTLDWTEMSAAGSPIDWVVGCYTETSNGTLLPIHEMRHLADRFGAKLFLDATASIGLEDHHHLADVVCYSSCKGLFGLTGASFISFFQPAQNAVPSFYLDLTTHLERRVTGPYHAIASLDHVLPHHDSFREAVQINKDRFLRAMSGFLTQPPQRQPQLCTHVTRKLKTAAPHAVTYSPRGSATGSVVCHLGEAHLGAQARGEILELLEWE